MYLVGSDSNLPHLIMSFLLGLAGFLLTIGIIVIVHEGGHFFTAKFFNIKVTRFSFGMGPVLWRRRKGETEYCFSALPLGGYVRMADEADADLTEEDRSRLYTRQARWKRGLVLFAGPATNFILAFFLYVMVGAIGMPDFAAVMGTPPAGTQAASENVRQGSRHHGHERRAFRSGGQRRHSRQVLPRG